ncbi:MAG TPA: bifunctional hydroxymethylpyrimidine kinase/phosphomethylpyrimidine kinase [Allosphingosinicella sp.]|uniref:bifunctional hydroxymethylpyrimidine kinase/phosphomethylpyrimidine kinase n=1 Tax=Allosphingosinicella sp. TaxID=2823234 RepID=UPI002F2A0391
MSVPRILIIAGSDSGGGAGIQADIKTVTMLGGHAMTAITAITAQNTLGVDAVMPVPAEMVLKQIDAVLGDIGADAVKIGMIGSAETAEAVADRLGGLDIPIVFDPVMIASSGSVLADEATIAAFQRLIAIASVVTPNEPELSALSGMEIRGRTDRDMSVEAVMDRTRCRALLVKGGHQLAEGQTHEVEDWLFDEAGNEHHWRAARIETKQTHGTGCTLASAIATYLARGWDLPRAVEAGRTFVRISLREAPGFGRGHGPMGQQAVRLDAPLGDEPVLNQLTLPTADYEASTRFYRTLGLSQIVDAPPRYARFECPGGATLSLHLDERAFAGATVIYFEANDLDRLVQRLEAAGLAIDSMPQDQPWLWREARLRDPAGNPICLYSAGENRRFPPWRLDRRD